MGETGSDGGGDDEPSPKPVLEPFEESKDSSWGLFSFFSTGWTFVGSKFPLWCSGGRWTRCGGDRGETKFRSNTGPRPTTCPSLTCVWSLVSPRIQRICPARGFLSASGSNFSSPKAIASVYSSGCPRPHLRKQKVRITLNKNTKKWTYKIKQF